MTNRYALIVGINTYLFMEDEYQLNGCENDAKLLRSTLINRFKFPAENITALFSKDATHQNIINAMEALLKRVETDDVVVFHYSGHGHECRVKTPRSDEASGTINAILPTDDSEPKGDGDAVHYREIREDYFNDWLTRMAEKTSNTTMIFDACHSGTMTRSADQETARVIPAEKRMQVIDESEIISPNSRSLNSLSDKKKTSSWLTLSDHHLVISACRDNQYAKEKYFQEGENRFKHGVLTYSLCAALQTVDSHTSFRDIFETVTSEVISRVDEQNPQIEGRVDREVFGIKDIEALNFIPVEEVKEDCITLSAGLAHGINVDDVWDVYPPFTKAVNEELKIAQLKVVDVDGLSARARVTSGVVDDINKGARCVLFEKCRSKPSVNVYISDEVSKVCKQLIEDLNSSDLITLSNSSEIANFTVDISNNDSQYNDINIDGKTRLPCLRVLNQQGRLAMRLSAVDDPQTSSKIVANLEKIAKYNNLLRLKNPNSGLNVEFNLFKRLPDDSFEKANGGTSDFDEQIPLVLEIKNNETERQLFFSILWLSANKEIIHFYPHRKHSEAISPGVTVTIGDGSRKLKASLGSYHLDTGTETCVVIFTSKPCDFSWLNQEGMREVNNDDGQFSEIDSAINGRNKLSAKVNNKESDWQLIHRSFSLHRDLKKTAKELAV